ncbi:SDR family oxidoreductase [Streptomyces sp. NPDC001770]
MNVLIVGGSGFLGSQIALTCAEAGAHPVSLSRGGRAVTGRAVRGDVRRPRLGLTGADLGHVRDTVTHVVLAFGSVDWACGPGEAMDTHSVAMQSVLRFLRELPALEHVVHVSSLLALGRAEGRVTNRELYTGQRFRNWYEYGKYCAEQLVRNATGDLPVTVVRFGPVLGPDPRGGRPDTRSGLPAVFPHLLAGYPVHLERRGDFPSWVTDARSASEVVLRALETPPAGATWSWFDPSMPTLAEVFEEVCRPWGVVPRIVEAKGLGRLTRLVGKRVGATPELTDYAEPWFDLDPAVLDAIPGPRPVPQPHYLTETGRALRGDLPQADAREVVR